MWGCPVIRGNQFMLRAGVISQMTIYSTNYSTTIWLCEKKKPKIIHWLQVSRDKCCLFPSVLYIIILNTFGHSFKYDMNLNMSAWASGLFSILTFYRQNRSHVIPKKKYTKQRTKGYSSLSRHIHLNTSRCKCSFANGSISNTAVKLRCWSCLLPLTEARVSREGTVSW